MSAHDRYLEPPEDDDYEREVDVDKWIENRKDGDDDRITQAERRYEDMLNRE